MNVPKRTGGKSTVFLTSILDGSEWYASSVSALIVSRDHGSIIRDVVSPRANRKIPSLPGIEPQSSSP
jgi:hypothetical protein